MITLPYWDNIDFKTGNPSTGTYRYYAQDHLGSLRALYDGNKAQTGLAEYGPYGTIRTATGPAELPGQTFTGKPLDVETGLYYFPFRYYSPTASRWLTRDPLGMVDGPNVYGYCKFTPVLLRDALGSNVIVGLFCALFPSWCEDDPVPTNC